MEKVLYTLRFFHPRNRVDDMPQCFCTVSASEIPEVGDELYLGNDHLLDGPEHFYLVRRVVRCYSGDKRDLVPNGGDALTSVELYVKQITEFGSV